MTTPDRELHPAEIELIQAKTKAAKIEARIGAIQLARAESDERDRLCKALLVRNLSINDAIMGTNTDKWIDALCFWERRDPGQPVTIDIMSPGGSITDGFAIFDQIQRMRRKGHHITTRAVGIAASMGAVLLQAGDVRIMDARAKLLIHEGSTTFGGTLTAAEQDDHRAFTEMLRSDILDLLAERSTLSRRSIQTKWRRKDWYLNAEEALKAGFVDAVE